MRLLAAFSWDFGLTIFSAGVFSDFGMRYRLGNGVWTGHRRLAIDGKFLGNDNTMLSCLMRTFNTYTFDPVEGLARHATFGNVGAVLG